MLLSNPTTVVYISAFFYILRAIFLHTFYTVFNGFFIKKKQAFNTGRGCSVGVSFNVLHPISKATGDYIAQNTYPVSLSKGGSLHRAGTICTAIYFIKKGAVRGFINDEGKDITTWISVENEVVASIYSFVKQVPSIENMQAIEDCEFLRMDQVDLERMYTISPDFNIAARRVYEKYYADAEVRALTVRLSNADKKYEFFLENYGHLSNRIPLTYIASFFGHEPGNT
ncbi:MAG: Crp/Fnr family transcriptional regulator [Saprospiraceae bacterium]|nr:Crp/Fnr family transcriptional regulator [Saprospiraceae bacterium]